MGLWKIIRPKANTNLITNPSFETGTTGWSDSGANTIEQSSEQSNAGGYSLKCTCDDDTILANYAIELDAGTYFFYAQVFIPSTWDGGDISVSSNGFVASATVIRQAESTATGTWAEIYSTQVLAGTDIGNMAIITSELSQSGAEHVYIDAAMILTGSDLETYIDGDQPGCIWTAVPHASTSTRLQYDRRGGEVLDLEDDLYFKVQRTSGTGMVESKNLTQPISNQGGATYGGNQTQPRYFSLTGAFSGGNTTLATYHTRKRAILQALNPKTNTDVDDAPLPVLIRYDTGSGTPKEVSAYYDGGLEDSWDVPYWEQRRTLRFAAVDPFFYDLGRPSKVLTTTDTATMTLVARRVGLPQNITADVWDNLGPPNASGTYVGIAAIVEDDTYVYYGGSSTNFDNIANADYIVRWHKVNRAWSALGTGMNGDVNALAISPAGVLYAGGAFTTAGGTTVRGVASWNGTAWAALGPPSSGGTVHAIAIDTSGNVYVGGAFTNWNGNANADYIAMWNGSAWSALGTGMNNDVLDIKIYDENLYAVGRFTTAGGTAVDGIAVWNSSAWAAVSADVFNGTTRKLLFDAGGNFYIAGEFADINSDTTLKFVAYWNGQSYVSLDGGVSTTASALGLDNDGNLYASGAFTSAGTISSLGDSFAKWNGSSWSHLDINLAGTGGGHAIHFSPNGDMYLGFGVALSGTATYAGITTLSYSGSAENYPTITIKRTGGTTARLVSIRNETTDAELTFDYALSDGETITIQLNPFDAVGLSSSFAGDVPGAILPGNDIGAFYLDPGNGSGAKDNVITCYVTTTGSPTILGLLQYRNAYLSQD